MREDCRGCRKDAIRTAGTLAAAGVCWAVCAWLLWRTSVPSLHLSGLDEHRFFSARQLQRSARFAHGEQALWLGGTLATLVALAVLAIRLPRTVASIGLGRIGSAVIVGMVLLTTLWAVSLPFGLVDLWWQHHWGLGPFDVLAWLDAQWATLGAEAISALLTIVLLVGLAGRFRRWWLVAGADLRRDRGVFALLSGWLARCRHAAASQPRPDRRRPAARARRGRQGTPVRVEDVSSWTSQANAFTTGFGPSTHVVIWDTLLDGRFSRGEENVVIAHELGHVRSRHIIKAIGWSALVVLPTLWLLSLALRRRGGLGRPRTCRTRSSCSRCWRC